MRAFTMSGNSLGSWGDAAKKAAAQATQTASGEAYSTWAASQQSQQNTGVALVGQYYPGSNASQLLDSSSYPQPQKSLLPWIIGGAVVLVFGGLFFFMRKR